MSVRAVHRKGSRAQENNVAALCHTLPGPIAKNNTSQNVTAEVSWSLAGCQIISADLNVTLLHVL